MKQLLLGLLVFLAACTAADSEPTLNSCNADEDCVPHPAFCHPHECINRAFAQDFERPELCIQVYDYEAAYKAEDCRCVQGQCINRNLGRAADVE